MNNTIMILFVVGAGAVIALAGVLLGVWISAKFTGAFTTVEPAEDVDIHVGAFADQDTGYSDERLPWLDPDIDPEHDPGANPANYTPV